MILINLVQKCPVADLKQPGRRFAIPAGFLQDRRDRISFGFTLDTLNQRFERRGTGGTLLSSVPVGKSVVMLPGIRAVRADAIAHMNWLKVAEGQISVSSYQIPFRETFQFFQVSGPGIPLAGLNQCRRQFPRRKAVLFCKAMHRVPQQDRDFVLSLAQRRHVNIESAEAIVQAFKEFLLCQRPLQVGSGRCQYPDIQ